MAVLNNLKLVVPAVACAGIFASVPALAQQRQQQQDLGYYTGIAVGQAEASDACSGITGIGFVGGCDEEDTAWKIFGGYQFHRNFAVELGYVDLGDFRASGTIGGIPASAATEVTGIELVAVGSIPITQQLGAYAKLGAFRWDADTRAAVGALAVGGDDNGTELTYGVGLKYDFTRSIAGRLEFQRYNNVGETNTTGQSDINLWTLGVAFKF